MSALKPYTTVKDIRVKSMSAEATPQLAPDDEPKQTEIQVRHKFELRTVFAGPDSPLDENEMAALLTVVITTPAGEIRAGVEGFYEVASDKTDLITDDQFLEFLNDEALVELVAYLRTLVSDLAMRVFRASLNIPPFSHLNLRFERDDESATQHEGS